MNNKFCHYCKRPVCQCDFAPTTFGPIGPRKLTPEQADSIRKWDRSDREAMAKEVCEEMGWSFRSVFCHSTDVLLIDYENHNGDLGEMDIEDVQKIHAILCRAKTAERQVVELEDRIKGFERALDNAWEERSGK